MNNRIAITLLSATALTLLMLLSSCEKKPKRPVEFSGFVIDYKKEPVIKATIDIGDFTARTDEKGYFKIIAETADRYVLNIHKEGFALTSRIHFTSSKNEKYYLYGATVVPVDPTKEFTVTDTKSKERPGSPASQDAWSKNPFSQVPLVYENGKLVDFGFPKELQEAFDYVVSRKNAGPGMSITIPGNSLVRTGSSNAPSGKVNVAVSTIDLFSQDAMPGDFSINNAEGKQRERGYMISFGAGSIEISDANYNYQLRPGTTAKIRIPIDLGQLAKPDSIPKTVPLFLYNEKTGYWEDHGQALLNADKSAYEGDIHHLSSFNMDIEKTTPACIKVRSLSTVGDLPEYKVEAIAKKGPNIIQKVRTITEPGTCLVKGSSGTGLHQLYNLPENQQMCLIFYDNSNVPITIIIPTTNATYKPGPLPGCTQPNCPGACADEALCDTDAGCNGYDGCAYVQFPKALDALLMTAKKGTVAGTVVIKWVYKNEVASTTYKLFETDPATGCPDGTEITPLTITQRTVNGGYKVNEVTITVANGTHYYKIKANDGTESNCFSADPVILP
jgi:hypothetical protein